jgi:glycosyltransferase involved in cell wall biosynthesis
MLKKRLLWVGSLESDEEFKIKSKKGYNLASAQVSQKNILLGIEKNTGKVFDSLNGSVLPHYPIYSDKVIEAVKWSHKENAYDISVGYTNKKYINRLTCKKSMIKEAKKWVEEKYNNEELVVLVYSMRSSVMATACKIKKLIPKAKIYLIITDLPQFMDLGESKLKTLLKKIDWIQIKKMQFKFDGFIIYASKMAEFLDIPDNEWILMEGLYDSSEIIQLKENKNKDKKVIMYSGKLDKEYGIEMLLNAFMKIDSYKYELWLTGGGNSEEYIKECAKKDSRIKYFGFLPSRNDVLKKQQEASVLLNMRLPSEIASAYCFPSKLLEYMVTGIPVLSFRIAGIPKEYDDYILFIEDETEESLICAIKKVLEMDEHIRDEIGERARNFVLSEKTTEKQCNRILDFIMKNDMEENYEKSFMGM